MAHHIENGRDELETAAVAFRVHEELDERLVEVWSNHRDPAARDRLRDYLESSRLLRGLESTEQLAQEEA